MRSPAYPLATYSEVCCKAAPSAGSDIAAGGQAFHQHAPTLANVLTAADDPVERNEHILALHRAIHECAIHWPVACANRYTRMGHGDQCAGNAELLSAAGQAQVYGIEGKGPTTDATGASVM
ncbi:hypothetical protein ACTMU2_04925 [Cupriavidus basilensis]